MPLAPLDTTTDMARLTLDPYPVYARMRRDTPVVRVAAVKRTFLTKAADCRRVKDDPELFSSDDPNTPMQPAFRAHTLMRKDGADHRRERDAMQPAFGPRAIRDHWMPMYRDIVEEALSGLKRGDTVDLFSDLCGPVSARILTQILGLHGASDAQMMHWSQALIDGAGNFGWAAEPFAVSDAANDAMDAHIAGLVARHRADPGPSALSLMVNADDPIPYAQIVSNLKIAIGGGINEPRDAAATIIFGLLTNPAQLEEVRRTDAWADAFEEGVRWVAPIQASSRLVLRDTQIGGCDVPKGDTVMTIQASANRDEDVFADGGLFDVFRARRPHQAFGSGPHICAGAHVARRTVGEILLPALFARFPAMRLTDPAAVEWRGFGFRGPINLPVTLN